MKNVQRILLFGFGFLFTFELTAQTVTGLNVTFVAYDALKPGYFQQSGEKQWLEKKVGIEGVHATFTETNRDDWSVYLRKNDGANIQLDLHTKKVIVNGSYLYPIKEVKADAVSINGRNATYVAYEAQPGGYFQQTGNKQWSEYKLGASGLHATFTETNRDDWSVYLKKSDGANIQLDLHTRKIKFNAGFLYNIKEAKAGPLVPDKPVIPVPETNIPISADFKKQYNIESKSNPGRFLDVYGGAAIQGAKVGLWSLNARYGTANQRFTCLDAGGGFFYLCSAINPLMAVTPLAGGTTDGTKVDLSILSPFNAKPKFKFLNVGNGYVKIAYGAGNNLFLGVADDNQDIVLRTGDKGDKILFKLSGFTVLPSRWMEGIKDEVSLAKINIPGTHDSGADFGCDGPYHKYAKCQDWSISTQLQNGIRYFDIRCRHINDVFTIHHGRCYQQKNFGNVLLDVQNFLAQNPSETILMRIKQEHDPENNSKTFAEVFTKYRNQYPNLSWYTGSSIPSLANARGKIVILDDAGLGIGVSFSGSSNIQDTYYLGDYDQKWNLVKNHLETAKSGSNSTLFINHCSATGLSSDAGDLIGSLFQGNKCPKDFADKIIPKLTTHLSGKGAQRIGIIAMDFPATAVITSILNLNTDNMK